MPSCKIYVSPNTITDLKAYEGTSLVIDTNEWTVSGDYLYASWFTSGGNLTFKATGYQDKSQEIDVGSNYVTMVAVPPKYISKLSDGTNTYVIKDAEARTGLASKQDVLISGTNIKTVGGASLLGSGNIALPTVDQTYSASSTNAQSGVAVASAISGKANDSDVIKKSGGSSQQTISLTSGTGTTAIGVKSMASSSYISFSGSSGWLASFGIGSNKKPTIYDGSSHTIAYTSDIPTVNNATLTIQKNGLNVATFTANASSNVTANIIVPNTVSSVSSSSTNEDAVGAKLFYDTVGDIESALNTINSGGGIQTVNLTVSLTGEPSYFQSITIDGVTYTSSSFTNNSMTVQIPKDTEVTWSATAVYSGYPLSGTLNESTDTTLSIQIYSGGGKS